jgi:hypothetical protein
MNKFGDLTSKFLIIASIFFTLVGIFDFFGFSYSFSNFGEPVAKIYETRDIKLQMIDNVALGNKIEIKSCNKSYSSIEKIDMKCFNDEIVKELQNFKAKILKNKNNIENLKEMRELVNASSLHYRNSETELQAGIYNNFISSYATSIGVVLGFLAIAFVIKIEHERLNNERKHYRKQAKENLSDILSYSIDLMEDIDQKHIDFFYTYKELRDAGIILNLYEIIKENEDASFETKIEHLIYKNLFSLNKHEIIPELRKIYPCNLILSLARFVNITTIDRWCFSRCFKKFLVSSLHDQEKIHTIFEKYTYISTRFIRKLYLEEEHLEKFIKFSDKQNKGKAKKILKKLYYQTFSKNFAEYRASQTQDIHTLNEEVKKIAPNIEEILLKKDFDLNSSEYRSISDVYLKILNNIKDFENIVEGKYTKKKLTTTSKNQKEIPKVKEQSNADETSKDVNELNKNKNNVIENGN